MLKFYDRENEIEFLKTIEQQSQQSAQMTLVVGKRRVGKTALLNRTFASSKTLYFFIEKQNEALLCEEFLEEIHQKFGPTIYSRISSFKQIFALLMDMSQKEHFTVIVDECHEFYNSNPTIYSKMQYVWDTKKDTSKINLILCSSSYSLMTKIFLNSEEPLFGRATARLDLKTFDIQTLKGILNDCYPEFTNKDLLAFYTVTGGVAKYVEQLANAGAFTLEKILDEIFVINSQFLEEGKAILIDEFGKDYSNYCSILSLIASSKTSRNEIESFMNISIDGYLDKLENEFGLIKKVKSPRTIPLGKVLKYRIDDNFLNFWFRFVYKYRSAIETGNFSYLRNIVERDYETFSGLMLERYFRQKLIESKQFSEIGNYWDRKGANERDIIALNEMERRLVFYEVKRNEKKISIAQLEKRMEKITANFPDYNIEYKEFSIEDM
jgi:AAA+ ATPase superfamily predicted ATPase